MDAKPTVAQSSSGIADVSDTALWVAVYRARESDRPDALFQDRLAHRLAGERGARIAKKMTGSRYTAWSLVIRTCIIDDYIGRAVTAGFAADGSDRIECIVNLGAGLDTRPYRLKLPADLLWIEADYPHMIEGKTAQLRDEKPVCRLERVAVDLGDDGARRRLLDSIAARSGKILVLTEGVIPYLTEDQVAALAVDLRSHPQFRYWIVDYFSPVLKKYFQSKRMLEQMKNAPFRFFPADWAGFFDRAGWRARETKYLAEESSRLGRAIPAPLLIKVLGPILGLFMSRKKKDSYRKFTAYVLLEPNA